MDVTYLDHVFASLVFLIFPVYARFTYPSVVAELREGGEAARIRVYGRTVLTWVLFGACVLIVWSLHDRVWSALGITWGQLDRQLIAALVATAVVAMFVLPLRKLARAENPEAGIEGLEDIFVLMPATERESRWFRGVSANAGITEELIFRGYLIWYLNNYVSAWLAAAIAVILFGYGHMYQGLKQLPGIMLVSAIAVSLYVYTDSLLIPVLYHALHDAVQGHYLASIRRRIESGKTSHASA